MLEDCDQFRIANGASPLLCHHKSHRNNNKDSCSKSKLSLVRLHNRIITEQNFFVQLTAQCHLQHQGEIIETGKKFLTVNTVANKDNWS